MKPHQLSDKQWALLGVLYLRPRPLGELKVRWRYAVRTVRACVGYGLVRTPTPLTARDACAIIELTPNGRAMVDKAADAIEARALARVREVA